MQWWNIHLEAIHLAFANKPIYTQICELTRIERVSPTFRDSYPHENLSFTSPALPMFHPYSVIVN